MYHGATHKYVVVIYLPLTFDHPNMVQYLFHSFNFIMERFYTTYLSKDLSNSSFVSF